MAKSQAVAVRERTQTEIEILAKVADLISAIPEAGGDGTAFVMRWLDITNPEDFISDDADEDSSADDLDDMHGHDIRVDSLTRWVSDFAETNQDAVTDQYLIVHGRNLTQDRDVVFAVGATTPIVKLAGMHKVQALPAVVRFRRSSKQTAKGYYPLNMSVLAVRTSATVDA